MKRRGFTEEEALEKLKIQGPNEIRDQNNSSVLRIFLRQVKNNFAVYFLFVTMIVSFFVGKDVTGYTIAVVLLIIVSVGFMQEYRAEKTIQSLKTLISPVSIVIRGEKEREVSSLDLVIGDIVVLRTGEKVPADMIVLEEFELRVNESVLTGESNEVVKTIAKSESNYKKENILFMGTFVVNGRAIGKVIHTGMDTKFGKIASLISETEKELPLQKKVNKVAKIIAIIGITMAIIISLILLSKSDEVNSELFVEILIIAIAISVSAFPEGFPVALLTTLSSGTYNMAKKNAIVNRMSIIETLGETTVICTDKTGTITKGEMTVRKIFADNKIIDVTGGGYEGHGNFLEDGRNISPLKDPVLNLILKGSVLCNDASINRKGEDSLYSVIGNSTESALLIMAAKANLFGEDLNSIRKAEIPFNSKRKLMSVQVKIGKDELIFTKGAPEILIEKCSFIQKRKKSFRLRSFGKEEIIKLSESLNSKAYRTIAIAYKPLSSLNKDNFEKDLIFLGIMVLEDPPRSEVKEAIKTCIDAGIKVKMITGDHKDTAYSIAKQIGLNGRIVTGDYLDRIDDAKLVSVVDKITIFARVKPEHKLRIVEALKKRGEIVTMTGDGVNDAPALKTAHIGVAMGRSGTDVSRSVADLTLKDNNFATIVEAISEGRTIFNNMRKFVTYQLSCNFAELTILFVAVLLGMPLPLMAIQILFMNLVTSDFPAITLGLNPHSKDIMQAPPRKKSSLLTKELFFVLAIAGFIMAFFTLGTFAFVYYYLNQPIEVARTTALVTLILFEITNAFNFRSFRKPVLTRSLLVNKYLVYASLVSILATILIIYTPLNIYFYSASISLYYWLSLIALSLILVVIFDILKFINKKYNFLEEHF